MRQRVRGRWLDHRPGLVGIREGGSYVPDMIYTLHGNRRELIVVAREGGLVRGYCKILPRVMTYGRVVEGREYAEITELWVGEECRREGIGTGLVRETFDWAKANGFSHVNVEVSAMSEAANLFWRSLGFIPRSTIHDIELES